MKRLYKNPILVSLVMLQNMKIILINFLHPQFINKNQENIEILFFHKDIGQLEKKEKHRLYKSLILSISYHQLVKRHELSPDEDWGGQKRGSQDYDREEEDG